jgi:hypothetical protein
MIRRLGLLILISETNQADVVCKKIYLTSAVIARQFC